MYKKVEAVGKAGVLIFIFLGMQVLIVSLFMLLTGLNGGAFEGYYEEHLYLVNGVIQLVTLLLLLGWDTLRHKKIREIFNLKINRRWLRYILYGVELWLFSSLLNSLLLPFFSDYKWQITQMFGNQEKGLRFVVLVILVPFLEEYLFRYKIQGYLKEGFGETLAILLQGMFFGLIHSMNLQKIYASVLGIGFGFVREKEGNLQSSIIMHMTINTIGFFIGSFVSI